MEKTIYKIKQKIADYHCTICRCFHNLVYCVQCNNVYCDSIHLCDHLYSFRSHHTLYSIKLKRLIKCCNKYCTETDIYELNICMSCIQNIFNRYYSMKTATWYACNPLLWSIREGKGLYMIMNCIACDKHFDWHIMNCEAANNPHKFISSEQVDNKFIDTHHCVSEYFF